jgi:hypothetical protein
MSDVSINDLPASGAPFRVGDVFGKAFSVFGNQLGGFLLLAFVPLIPVLAVSLLAPAGPVVAQTAQTTPGLAGLSTFLTFVLQIVVQATTLYAAFQQLGGSPFSITQSLGVGFGRLLPVLGVALLSGILAGLATILLVVPGIIVLCMLYVAAPVCVIEKPGVIASLHRSAELTKGYRWPIFGIVALVGIVGIIAQFVLRGLFGVATVWGKLLSFSWLVIVTSFGAVLVAVAYHDLRVAKEGTDIDNLANIFD